MEKIVEENCRKLLVTPITGSVCRESSWGKNDKKKKTDRRCKRSCVEWVNRRLDAKTHFYNYVFQMGMCEILVFHHQREEERKTSGFFRFLICLTFKSVDRRVSVFVVRH